MTDYKEKYQEAKKLISEQKKVIKKQENFIEGPPRSRTGGESASCDNRDLQGIACKPYIILGGLRLFQDVALEEGDEMILAGVVVGSNNRGDEVNAIRGIEE